MRRLLKILLHSIIIGLILHNTYSIYRMTPTYVNNIIYNNANIIRQLEQTVKRNKIIVNKLDYNSIIKVDKKATYILTAQHVIDERKIVQVGNTLTTITIPSTDIMVTIKGKDYTAFLIKEDKDLDIAVIKIYKKIKVTPIKIAKEEPDLGTTVWAVSNPGTRKNIINKGIFSSINKKSSIVSTAGFFGSSGGMVLNEKGEQIGVISTIIMTRVEAFFPNITVYNGITRTKELNKFLKDIL